MRFTSRQHLKSSAEFQSVRASGYRRECGAFLLQVRVYRADERPPLRRLGVVASKRVGNAVVRNRAKRLLRETFRLNQPLLPENSDTVLVARARIRGMRQTEVAEVFRRALARLELAPAAATEAAAPTTAPEEA